MRFEQIAKPVEFQQRSSDLLSDEARHNLIRGVLNTLVTDPTVYESYRMVLVTDDSEVMAAALMTHPYNLIVADTKDERALDTLVAGVADADYTVPGVVGNEPTVSRFVELWRAASGDEAVLTMAQGVFALETVEAVPPSSGAARVATADDLDLVTEWFRGFFAEAIPDEPHDDERLRAELEKRLRRGGSTGLWLWEQDEGAVSLSGHGSPTGSGIRIGPVYTPPEHRAHGYATSLVAAHSQWLLNNGYAFCFLFTDLSNPTSNRIYESIGYRRVAESASYRFVPANPAT